MADFKLSANFEVLKQAPLDERLAKGTKADLINPASWSQDNGTYYVHQYMIVGTADGVFMLMDVDKMFDTDYSGWKQIGASGSSSEDIDLTEVQQMIDESIASAGFLTEVPERYVTEVELEERLAVFNPGGPTSGITEAQAQAMVNVEKNRATSAETALQADIDAEILRAKSYEEDLNELITVETANRTIADNTINDAIASEQDRAIAAENVLNDSIVALDSKIPTKTSQLENDSDYLTSTQAVVDFATKDDLNAKQDLISDLDAIRAGATRELPTNLSQLTNDVGYITEEQATETYATKNELSTKQDVISDLDDIRYNASRVIPTKVSQLANDLGYLTEHQDLSHLVTHDDIADVTAAAAAAESNSEEALLTANTAKVTADTAKTQSDVAIESIRSLQGLSDADEAMVELANQITQIELNTSNITALQSKHHDPMTEDELLALEEAGGLVEGTFYYTYEE